MFIGEYSATIDEKGRVSIPSKFRQELKGKAIVTRGLDNSLFLYTETEWLKVAEKLSTLPFSKSSRANEPINPPPGRISVLF